MQSSDCKGYFALLSIYMSIKYYESKAQRNMNDLDSKNIERFFCSALDRVLTMPDGNSWDTILCYIGDTGYFSIDIVKANVPFTYENTRESLQQYDQVQHFKTTPEFKTPIIYESSYFNERFERIESIEDEEEWEKEFDRYTEERILCLRKALSQSETFKRNYPNDKYGVYAAIEPEVVYEVNLIHLFGRRIPLPSTPKTSLEIFSRLIHSIHSGVHENGNVYFDCGNLIRVELNGADFTNEKAFLLKDFESDVGRLCADLKVIDVRNGRVTEEGLDYLKRLLSNVEIHS